MKTYDCIVLGTGGVGSAVLYHLARRGVRALGLDRFPPGHDRGSSHGDTRIIRQAYFEHPDYVPLLKRAYDLWAALSARSGKKLYHEVGLLQAGPPEGTVVPGVIESARRHGLAVERMSAREARDRFPAFRIPDSHEAVFERRAGYLRVEECVRTHAAEAVKLGAALETGVEARRWAPEGEGIMVETERETYHAGRLVVTAGSWAPAVLASLGLKLRVLRKVLLWYRAEGDEHRQDHCPCFLFETPAGIFYGFPRIDENGLKVAEHTGGEPVEDPLQVDRSLRPSDRAPVEKFLEAHLPGAGGEPLRHVVCLYTMTPDENFVVDRHPDHPQVVFAAGLSGHGFKFTSVLGEALAALALEGSTTLPVGFLGLERPGLR